MINKVVALEKKISNFLETIIMLEGIIELAHSQVEKNTELATLAIIPTQITKAPPIHPNVKTYLSRYYQ